MIFLQDENPNLFGFGIDVFDFFSAYCGKKNVVGRIVTLGV